MPYATDADLTARVPAASAISAAVRQTALDDAKEWIDDNLADGKTVRAHVLLAAHFLALTNASDLGDAAAPVVASMNAGAIAVSYATTAPDAAAGSLGRTRFGQEFLEIMRRVPYRPGVG